MPIQLKLEVRMGEYSERPVWHKPSLRQRCQTKVVSADPINTEPKSPNPNCCKLNKFQIPNPELLQIPRRLSLVWIGGRLFH